MVDQDAAVISVHEGLHQSWNESSSTAQFLRSEKKHSSLQTRTMQQLCCNMHTHNDQTDLPGCTCFAIQMQLSSLQLGMYLCLDSDPDPCSSNNGMLIAAELTHTLQTMQAEPIIVYVCAVVNLSKRCRPGLTGAMAAPVTTSPGSLTHGLGMCSAVMR